MWNRHSRSSLYYGKLLMLFVSALEHTSLLIKIYSARLIRQMGFSVYSYHFLADMQNHIPYNGKFSHRPIFAEFCGQYQSAKIKIHEIFSYFWKISVEELVEYMVADCGSYLFACGKTSNMQLSQNNLSLQAIWLEVSWSMTVLIYSVSRWLIFFCCCIWHTCNCVLVSLLNNVCIYATFRMHNELFYGEKCHMTQLSEFK